MIIFYLLHLCLYVYAYRLYYNPIEYSISNLLFYYLKCKSWNTFFIIKYTFTVYFYCLIELSYVDRHDLFKLLQFYIDICIFYFFYYFALFYNKVTLLKVTSFTFIFFCRIECKELSDISNRRHFMVLIMPNSSFWWKRITNR